MPAYHDPDDLLVVTFKNLAVENAAQVHGSRPADFR